MDHNSCEERLPDFILGGLNQEEAKAVEFHLAACAICRARLEELKPVFEELGARVSPQAPDLYFTTILPRVREKLEQQRTRLPVNRFVLSRLALPLAALVLVVAVTLNIPLTGGKEEAQSLEEIVGSLESEDLMDVLVEQSGRESPGQLSGAEAIAEAVPERIISREIARTMLDERRVAEAVFTQVFPDVDEEEVELILQKLGERTLL